METLPEIRHMPIMPIMSVEDAISRRKAVATFARSIMKQDVDYGVIPGTNGKKTLLKPGAEKLATLFGLSTRYEVMDKSVDWSGELHGGEAFFYFQYKCQLYYSNMLVGEGIGSCNSWEKKYRYRKGERICPECGQPSIIKRKKEYGGGWLCFGRKGGCGAKWEDGDASIEGQNTNQVPNDNAADLVNTIDKMAQKRALVGAVLVTTNASEFFTQDMGDDVDVIDIESVDISEGSTSSAPIPDMVTPKDDGTPPSDGHLGVLFGHLKRLGVRDSHKRKLVEFVQSEGVTAAKVTEAIKAMEYVEKLPRQWFSNYVSMLLVDHPKYDKKALGVFCADHFGNAGVDAWTQEQRDKLLDWLMLVEIGDPEDADVYTPGKPEDEAEANPWLVEVTRIQNETGEDVERIEDWLLKEYGRGNYKSVTDMPTHGIKIVQSMNADTIKKSMDTVPML